MMLQSNREASKKLCFVVTDARSFNGLCDGQFEFFIKQELVELTLVCGGNEEDISALKRRDVGRVVDIKFVRQPSLFKDIKAFSRLIYFFFKNEFDAIVYSTPKALLLASLASAMSGQRNRIGIIRGRVYENTYGFSRHFWIFLDRITFIASHKLLFISESLLSAYRKDGLAQNSFSFVVGNGSSAGVCLSKFSPSISTCSAVRKALGIEPGSFVVVIVGRLCVDKGVEDLVDVISRVSNPRVVFVVVGPVEDKAARIVVETLLKKADNCFYVGSAEDTTPYFVAADLHLFLSHREGFGNVAIEAAACAVATLGYNVVGVRDSISHGQSGWLVEFGRTDHVARRIEWAAQDVDSIKATGVAARKWAVSKFDQEYVWKLYLDQFLS